MKSLTTLVSLLLISFVQNLQAENFHTRFQKQSHLFEERGIADASSIVTRRDSTYTYVWDSLMGSWQLNQREIFQSNYMGHVITSTTYTWTGLGWENYFKDSMAYDSNFNITYWLFQSWYGSYWENFSQYFSNYNANNQYIYDLHQTWDGVAWVNFGQIHYWWNSFNKLDSMHSEGWNSLSWRNLRFTTYQYDINQNLTSEINLAWDSTSWVNSSQRIYNYDSLDNLTEILLQVWDSTSLVNFSKQNYLYDSNSNLIFILDSTWNVNSWEFNYGLHYYYDGNNVNSDYVVTTEFSVDSTHVFYTDITGIVEYADDRYNVLVYPNPSDDILNINISELRDSNLKLNILDIEGREILTKTYAISETDQTYSLDIGNMKTGIYFIKIQMNGKTIIRKLVKS